MMDIRLYDHDGNPVGELSQAAGTLTKCDMTLEINGEHSLSVETTRHLDVGTRALTRGRDGRWREWVVDEQEETHSNGPHAVGSYHMIWSLQYDLQGVNPGNVVQPGMASHTTARNALSMALSGTSRWGVGTCDVTTRNGAVMAFNSAWDRLNTVVKYWGGNVDAEIEVGETGVRSRRVALLQHQGSAEATRRLEWHHDLTSITRTPDPGPYYCRVIPFGNGDTEYADDDETTISWKLDIGEVNGGVIYLRDTEAERLFRVSDGRGGYEYPTVAVDYSTDDPDELLALGQEDLHAHTRPSVSYTGTVSQFVEAGMDVDDIALGDEVQIVDYGFHEGVPLRVQERVLRIEVDMLGISDERLTIGKLRQSIERTMSNITKAIGDKVTAVAPVYAREDYGYEVPLHDYYVVETPEGTRTINATPVSYVAPDFGASIDGLDSRIGAIEAAAGIGVGASAAEAAGGGLLGDGIIHQLNGVKIKTGSVINFTTAAKKGSASGASEGISHGIDAITAKSWGSDAKPTKSGGKDSWKDMGGGSWGSDGGGF